MAPTVRQAQIHVAIAHSQCFTITDTHRGLSTLDPNLKRANTSRFPIPSAGKVAVSYRASKGTVIVFGFSQDEIVVAADSRSSFVQAKHWQGGNDHKVISLDNYLLFAVAGVQKICHNKPQFSYDACDLARRALNSFYMSGSEFSPKTVADKWGKLMTQALERHARGSSGTFLNFMSHLASRSIVEGIFAGVRPDDMLELIHASVECLLDDHRSPQINAKTSSYALQESMTFGVLGKGEIFHEFHMSTSDRARKEHAQWRAEQASKPESRGDLDWAIRLVELTIGLHPERDQVGEPIEAARLTSSGGVQWVRQAEV